MINFERKVLSTTLLASLLVTVSCGKKEGTPKPLSAENVVSGAHPQTDREIGDGDLRYQVRGLTAEKKAIDEGKATSPATVAGQEKIEKIAAEKGQSILPVEETSSASASEEEEPTTTEPQPSTEMVEAPTAVEPEAESLRIGFPVRLLGEGVIFGGVITKVSATDSETLGRLKLIELDPLHVRTQLAKTGENEYAVALMGCMSECGELSTQQALITIPMSSVDEDFVYLDVAALGKDLSLIGIIDPQGEYTGLEEKFSRATFVDFTSSTLVFDVESHMVPKVAASEGEGAEAGEEPVTVITARWYLKLESGMNSAFESRLPRTEVGFFGTSRNKTERIVRHSLTTYGADESPVHYYLKNIPEDIKVHVEASFAEWNHAFKEVMDRPFFSYEFIDESSDSTLLEQVVAGDVRFNVLEWDNVNLAPYGGLGPSIASQNTGEIFSSNVLIQGPTILNLYREWFKVQEEAEELLANEDELGAERLMLKFSRKIAARNERISQMPKLDVRLGRLKLKVPADQVQLEDPAFARMDFYDTPEGYTYESYMKGYWLELITHELGHNVGLRHNFRGNLFGDEAGEVPSSSVMEYLGRPYRHKNKIGEYDKMAIAYGYAGDTPARADMFCTDEHVPSSDDIQLSAECSRDDATRDPFAMLLGHFKRAIDLGIGRSHPYAPSWTVEDLKSEVTKATNGLGFYASSAKGHLDSWTGWLKEGRPSDALEVPAYVKASIKAKLCDPGIEVVIRSKNSAEAKKAARDNIVGLRKVVKEALGTFGEDVVVDSCD